MNTVTLSSLQYNNYISYRLINNDAFLSLNTLTQWSENN